MSKEDLMNIIGSSSTNSLYDELKKRVKTALIINIYLVDGEQIKIGPGSPDRLSVSSIINITNDFLTIKFDSHQSNIMYNGIKKIEYFYKE